MKLTNKLISHVQLFFALQLILCGCVPAFYTYWAPRAEGGKLSSHGQLAHSNSVEFVFDGVKVSFTGQGTFVGMSLDIPKGKSVAFTSDKMDVYIPEKRQVVFDVRSYSTKPDGGDHFNPTVSLQLTFYATHIVISDSEKTVYKIKMPNIIVNGKAFNIPEMEFTKGKGIGIFG
jgi:hypothetical protein